MNALMRIKVKNLYIGLSLGAISLFPIYSHANDKALFSDVEVIKEQAGTEKFQIQSIINLDGVSVTPVSIVKNGENVAIFVNGKSSNWDINFHVKSQKSDSGVERVVMDLTVKKDGEVFSHPRLITDLNKLASIKQIDDVNSFEFSFEPRKID